MFLAMFLLMMPEESRYIKKGLEKLLASISPDKNARGLERGKKSTFHDLEILSMANDVKTPVVGFAVKMGEE
jgi:hypothetical protein